ncbi:sigma factor binding protein 1, chloroplastic-like [Phalaenopsis equestris]|uniref:sigma factor binding protein 1, chloroplastic-like n=1 Tax=Phalaenopsis equestris TaxID=78828 RepID=UPI0009E3F194|nr:sigma factor binding protein 1, chloroplastic-like [Phalaenopsis equestris]
MDPTSRSANQSRLLKQTNFEPPTKKKTKSQHEVKVVHFSNPVRVTTTAADFRALVQKLTGRDSHIDDFFAGVPPETTAGRVCDSYGSLDLLSGGVSEKAGIFDLPPVDFKVESGYGDEDSFEMYGDFTESVVIETPVMAGDLFCGWVL